MLSLNTLRASGMTALLLATSGTIASAADMLGAPPPPPVPVATSVMGDSGFYLRGDIMAATYGTVKPGYTAPPAGVVISQKSGSIAETVALDLGIGYQVNSWLRGDITAEYRRPTKYKITEFVTTDPFTPAVGPGNPGINFGKGKVGATLALVNGYVDLGTWNRITPFLGVGIGLAHVTVNNVKDIGAGPYTGGYGLARSKSTTNFAWALHAGLGYDLGGNWKAEAGYRYLNMGKADSATIVCSLACAPYHTHIKTLDAHEMKVGLRYMFADAAPVYAPGPLVRKY